MFSKLKFLISKIPRRSTPYTWHFINQDGIDHINFQLITNLSFKNDIVFCSQAQNHNALQTAMKDLYAL